MTEAPLVGESAKHSGCSALLRTEPIRPVFADSSFLTLVSVTDPDIERGMDRSVVSRLANQHFTAARQESLRLECTSQIIPPS